jgi:hypothetical protein
VQGTHPRDHNQTLGQRCHAALVQAAQQKAEALRAKKLAERTFERVLLSTEGKTVSEREAKARADAKVIAVEDAAIEAESAAIVAKARADGMQIEFEEFRTNAATTRAEMTLR